MKSKDLERMTSMPSFAKLYIYFRYFSTCVFGCVRVDTDVCLCGCKCMCIHRGQQSISGIIPQEPYNLRKGLSFGLELDIRLG